MGSGLRSQLTTQTVLSWSVEWCAAISQVLDSDDRQTAV
jgi:hypothetical protein